MACTKKTVILFFLCVCLVEEAGRGLSPSTGNWSTGPHGGSTIAPAAGNTMAAAVAVKTGVLQQLTHFNAASLLSHIRQIEAYAPFLSALVWWVWNPGICLKRRVCTPLDRVGRGSRPRQLRSAVRRQWVSLSLFGVVPRRHVSHFGYLCPVGVFTVCFIYAFFHVPCRLCAYCHRFYLCPRSKYPLCPVETPEGPACGLIAPRSVSRWVDETGWGHQGVCARIPCDVDSRPSAPSRRAGRHQ